MNATFSEGAETILSRHKNVRENLLKTIAPLPGACFIDGRVGRTGSTDELILMCASRDPLPVPSNEFRDEVGFQRILQEWGSKTE